MSFPRRCALILGLPVFCCGCLDPGYFFHIAGGELRSLSRARDIDRVLAEGAVTPEQARQLALVKRVRDYARDVVGLHAGRAYTQFEDNAGAPVAYAVSGARRDKLEPYVWTYPFIGRYDAKGFFDQKLAEREAARLHKKGYDAIIGEVAGFSTMGVFADPIRASNLTGDDFDLASLVLHELTHNTIFKTSDTQFNESMATFMGRRAALRFFQDSYGPDSTEATAASQRVADAGLIDSYVCDLYRRLDALYRESFPSDAKIARRETIFEEHRKRFDQEYAPRLHEARRYRSIVGVATNNATVLSAYRYHSELDIYADVFAALGSDFRAMLDVLRQAARQRDSQAFLRDWLARRKSAA